MKGVIYFELLDINQTITANVYCQQLQRLNKVLLQKRSPLANQKGFILVHDNGRPRVAKLTQQKNRIVRMGSSCTRTVLTRTCAIQLSSVRIPSLLSVQQTL